MGDADAVVDARLVAPGTGWVLTEHELARTIDDGRSWTDATPTGLVIHPIDEAARGVTNVYGLGALDARHAFIATEVIGRVDFTMTIWRTADGGGSWRTATLRHLDQTGYDQCPTCGGGGVTFHILSASDAFMDYGYIQGTDLEAHPIFRTSDGGATWQRVGMGGTLMSFAAAFRTPDTVVVSDGTSLFSTTTGWDHLTQVALDEDTDVGPMSTIAFVTARRWLVGLRAEAFKLAATDDAGQSWHVGRRALPSPGAGRVYTEIAVVAFLDTLTWVAAADSCTTNGRNCTSRLLRSRDRGHTWQPLGALPPGIRSSDRITFIDRFHGWAESFGGEGQPPAALYSTDNGGWSWRMLRS